MRDPKVAKLSDADFRLWIELLSVASDNDGIIPPLDDLKHLLRRRLDHLSKALDRLIRGLLIEVLDGCYRPINWDKLQYISDTSTERSRKHRAKCNVAATPPDTETETDTYKKDTNVSKKRKKQIDKNWTPLPFSDKTQCAQILQSWDKDFHDQQVEAFINYHQSKSTLSADWQASWRTWVLNSRKFSNERNSKPRTKTDPAVQAAIDQARKKSVGGGGLLQ